MKLIVGLGNPGTKYDGTRHNLGFAVVDALAKRWAIEMAREKFHAFFGDGVVRDQRVALLKPTTFMNRSGQAVSAAGPRNKTELKRVGGLRRWRVEAFGEALLQALWSPQGS